jgi:CxxC motif-containing protein (DUF1111 family)
MRAKVTLARAKIHEPSLPPTRLSPVRLACLAVAIFVGWGATLAGHSRAEEPTSAIERGRELFVRSWQPYDDETPAGDGLGPMYNAQSCADCHHQGGVGGSGGLMHNVQLLCLVPPERTTRLDRRQREKFVESIRKIHPALVTSRFTALPAITLHKFGENPAYDKWRVVLLMLVNHLAPGEVPERIGLRLAERSTPALFGAGLIDSIPNQVLEETARRQAAIASGVKGKVAPATDGGVGKFGWRGQTSSLKQFVMGACANELGLVVPDNDQPLDPLEPEHKSPGLDLDQKQCDIPVAYVASLPPPAERLPSSQAEKEHWAEGSKLFKRIGCAECHVPKLGEVVGIYSDLLLHDMGSELSDRAAANSPGRPRRSPGSSPQYYGGPEDVFATLAAETMRQWRTPPLWGVADSAPYLHDGRAPTLDDAILQHEGEATRAKKRYAALTIQRRKQLLAYLESLGHPSP